MLGTRSIESLFAFTTGVCILTSRFYREKKELSFAGMMKTRIPNSLVSLSAAGFYFALIQTALYFSIEVYVTATFTGYFLMVLVWMAGVTFSLKANFLPGFISLLLLSLVSTYLFVYITAAFSISYLTFAFFLLFIFISALPAGSFFRELSPSISSDTLFLHEINGFIVGTIVGLLFFVKFGVLFIFFAPIVGLAFVFLYWNDKEIPAFVLFFAILIFFSIIGYWIGVVVFSAITVLIQLGRKYIVKPVQNSQSFSQNEFETFSKRESKLLLVLSGFNLIILQYYIVREFSIIISANELSILLVSAAYFTGFSIGYSVSLKMPSKALKTFGVLAFGLHLFILTSIKFFIYSFSLLHVTFEGMVVLLFIVSFLTSSFYSLFLPRIIQLSGATQLSDYYITELIGAALGILYTMGLLAVAPKTLLPIYFLLMITIVAILLGKRKWRYIFVLVSFFLFAMYVFHQNGLTKSATEDFYASIGYQNPKLLSSNSSYYHTVDVLSTYSDKNQKLRTDKISFINGQKYFEQFYPLYSETRDESSLSEFTYFLARLPSEYKFNMDKRKQRILILGGGSLYSIHRVAAYASKVTVVEIDKAVVESAMKEWGDFNRLTEHKNYEIIIDDAKHYLNHTKEKFDLIIMDISAPYYLGSALLHNEDFFKLVKEKLAEGGVFSESTQGRPYSANPEGTPIKILESVDNVFPHYLLLDCVASPRGRRSFLYATQKDTIIRNSVNTILMQENKNVGTVLYQKSSQPFNLSRVKPFSLYSMENLWEGNFKRITSRIEFQNSNKTFSPSHFLSYLKKNIFTLQTFMGAALVTFLVFLIQLKM